MYVAEAAASEVFFKIAVLPIMLQMIKISSVKVYIFCKAAAAALQKTYTFTGNFLSKLSK